MSNIKIRESRMDDIPQILLVYEQAKLFMRSRGNLEQWTGGYPSELIIAADIAKHQHFIGKDDDGNVLVVFAFIEGKDPTYNYIEDGAWPDNRPYGTIHRIASSGLRAGMLQAALDFCFSRIDTIRIDTHADNHPMLDALKKQHFTRCGIIYLADGNPRTAFHKTINKS